MPKRLPRPESETPPSRPVLASEPPCFLRLEREVEIEFRPLMLAALQSKVGAVADPAPREAVLNCTECGQAMHYHDIRSVTWLARFGKLHASVARYNPVASFSRSPTNWCSRPHVRCYDRWTRRAGGTRSRPQ